jgi:hypothetical protein
MGPAYYDSTYEETCDRNARGHIQIGPIHVMWDFTELIKARRRSEALSERGNHLITTDGRTLMPKFGIL